MSPALLGFLVGVPVGAVALCVLQALRPRPRRAWETYPPRRTDRDTPPLPGPAFRRWLRETNAAPPPPRPDTHDDGVPVEIPEDSRWPPLF